MAIYHFSAKIISRGKGQSAIAAAAYRSGEVLRDEQAGEAKAYQERSNRILFTGIMAPKEAPAWAYDRNRLWNEAERAERRKDAQLAREIEVSLPHELTAEQREWLVKDFAREAFVRKGFAVDIAIHAPDRRSDDRNHHAHLLITRRALGAEGFAPTKDWQFDRNQLGQWREQWAHLANRHLERHGHAERIDHRSLEAQGADREPTVHLGYAAKEMAQRGAASDRVEALNEVLARNGVRSEIRIADRELADLERQEAAVRATPVPNLAPATKPLEESQARHQAAEAEARQQPSRGETERRQQAAWREDVKERLPRPQTPRQQGGAGLKVMDSATGAVTGLADFILDLFGGAASAPTRDTKRMSPSDPEDRRQQQIARLDAIRAEERDAKAVESIRRDMQVGKSLKAEDVRNLTHTHQEQIRLFGDTSVQQMVEDARRRSETLFKGHERERDR